MKETLGQNIEEYKKQMKLENVPNAYRGLMEYMMNLRTHFINHYPADLVVGSFYQGYMDMSYFPATPTSLKSQKLKIGLVFNHEKIRFEIWLVGQNKQIQKKYWELLNSSDWNRYVISSTARTSIIEHVLVEDPNFDQLDLLTEKIENEMLTFIKEIKNVLA